MQVTKSHHCIFSHLATLGFAMGGGGGETPCTNTNKTNFTQEHEVFC